MNVEVWCASHSARGTETGLFKFSRGGRDRPAAPRCRHERRSALLEVTKAVGRAHPDEVFLQPAMRVDPGLDVGAVAAPQRRRGLGKIGLMEAEARLRRHTNTAARNVLEQHRA